MIPYDEAIRIVDASLAGCTLPWERVAARRAVGRVLAADQVSRLDLPPFDRSAMDGYAVPEGEERDEYRLVGIVAAGQVSTARLEAGTTVKVMTGAPVPPGTLKVVKVEDTECDGSTIRVHRHSSTRHVCPQGEDVLAGDTILASGTVLTPRHIANLISCGVVEVAVVRRPRVAILCTGDEIADSPDDLSPGCIMNANGPLLGALAERCGLEVVREEIVPDRLEDTRAAIASSLEIADIIAASGGVSVGDFDYVPAALAELGLRLLFAGVAIKPGKPIAYATDGSRALFGLPGNPVAAYLTFHLFLLRAAARMVGSSPGLGERPLLMAQDYSRRDTARREYVPATLDEGGAVCPIEYHGSAHLMALSGMDGLFVMPVGVERIGSGEPVQFLSVARGLS